MNPQIGKLLTGFDPLSKSLKTEALGQYDNRFNDRLAFRIDPDITHKTLIDLQGVQGQFFR